MTKQEMKIEEVKAALITEAKSRKMNRWDAMNFVAGYTGWDMSLKDAMEIVNLGFMLDVIKK